MRFFLVFFVLFASELILGRLFWVEGLVESLDHRVSFVGCLRPLIPLSSPAVWLVGGESHTYFVPLHFSVCGVCIAAYQDRDRKLHNSNVRSKCGTCSNSVLSVELINITPRYRAGLALLEGNEISRLEIHRSISSHPVSVRNADVESRMI